MLNFKYTENIGMAFSIGNISIAVMLSILITTLIIVYMIKNII